MFGFVAAEAMIGRVGGTHLRGGRLHLQHL